ncbi:hypothetical protein BATDEDRAFT_28069 [Batrachochytrium dendrobatidis JAM81]|uniref:Uncharacterized protein n=3 Tax=Batrachochytrium dendrobatidis TaxID=109871 RepID=F4PCR1_BATDJ|nr:uncharacterized protein BATDEDRAFT_28069 [Batrachochytrium dendrobatidis JAM81]EGF76872.1 hypothetical protein BATDEDRAFT_28069 [Batrachochytrium dendrobatidis JAM81]OAJ44948.1 hypothetical protein BDEG_28126 [Batrachochytrium dendrobatidis JEL423]|eukprot:XP_006682396.1 hypothetical protein BATDEDRAFT_28069 [Batrachochytrium dendrobatidis JAM81]
MNLPLLFDTVVLHAHEAKKLYISGDLHSACLRTGEALRGATALLEILSNPSILPSTQTLHNAAAVTASAVAYAATPQHTSSQQPLVSTPTAYPSHLLSTSLYHQPASTDVYSTNPALPPNEPVSEYMAVDLADPVQKTQQTDTFEDDDTQEQYTPSTMLSNPVIMQALDDVFFDFLANVCSNLDAHDRFGVKIHHTLTALKVSRLAETGGFARFKVRIKSFTQAFMDEVERFSKQLPQLANVHRHIVQSYLLQQRYLCRFSEESKKFKSNGFLVWVVGARKTIHNEEVQWEFRDFVPDIVGPEPVESIRIGEHFTYKPRVYDPQSRDTSAVFHSPWLPYWLQWRGNILYGIPDINSQACEITVNASFKSISGNDITLERTFELRIIKE